MKMRDILLFFFVFVMSVIYGQKTEPPEMELSTSLHSGLTERIGNFSIELLYATAKQQAGKNFIMSPITIWTVLAAIAEGAVSNTLVQIDHAIRVSSKQRDTVRSVFQEIYKWLNVNTTTVELANVNTAFIEQNRSLLRDYQSLVESTYKIKVVPLDFSNSEWTASVINQAISKVTHGRIPKLVESGDLNGQQMILTSAVYFKGQWTVPFNASSTTKMPFFNSSGHKIGEVNMMYNRFTYPFANIKEFKARVIELPYGKEDRLSMLIMLPNQGVSVEDMFLNFIKVPLDTLFEELRFSKEEYGDDEVDCFIPRFKIESNLDMTNILQSFGIADLFDASLARLPKMARNELFVSKVAHKAEIEVTEDGTTASAVSAAEFSNRMGVVQFAANRAFCYLIVEKVTNSIVFGGIYESPTLY